jgi:hypothetical protein
MNGGGIDLGPYLVSDAMMGAEVAIEEWLPRGTHLGLLGTVHGDPRGCKRLHRFLQGFKPDLLLVELSPFAWTIRKAYRHSLHRTLNENIRQAARISNLDWRQAFAHPEVQAIRRQIAMPFEFRACHHYARTNNKWMFLIDRSDFSVALVSHWSELLSITNLTLLLSLPATRKQQAVANQYRRAHRLVHSPPPPQTCILPSSSAESSEDRWLDREFSLAERIRSIIDAIVPARCVYVGGWEHLGNQADPPNLRSLLGVCVEQCHLLNDFDPGVTKRDGTPGLSPLATEPADSPVVATSNVTTQ